MLIKFYVGLHILVLLGIVSTAKTSLVALLLFLVSVNIYISWRQWSRIRRIKRIQLHDKRCYLVIDDVRVEAIIQADSVVTSFCILINASLAHGKRPKKIYLPLLKDSMDQKDFRLLRLYLKQ